MSKITKTILIILISILFIFTTKCFAIDLNLPDEEESSNTTNSSNVSSNSNNSRNTSNTSSNTNTSSSDDEYEEKYNSFRIPICGSVDWVLPAICLPVCLLHRQSHE